MTFIRAAQALVLALSLAGTAAAQDAEGGKDHPLVGRYDGAVIDTYEDNAYDEFYFIQSPYDWAAVVPNNQTDRSGSEWLGVEGRVVKIRYIAPAQRSSLEIFRNYELALKDKGFEVMFSCSDAKCFVGDKFTLPYQMGELFDHKPGNSMAYWDHARYLLTRLPDPNGAIYAMVLVGENKGAAVVYVVVAETTEMDIDKIVVKSADEMEEGIGEMGSVNLYTLYFDFDKAVLKPESGPTLDEIVKLLAQAPDLKLNIVGHTDNQGTASYNLDLSQRRAAAVVEALVTTRGIDPARLTSGGKGLGRPIASNDTEEGRALNRRVELIRIQ